VAVERVSTCHCASEVAGQTFKQDYGDDFLDVGAGRLIEMP
jgi:metal-dependent hydrolase (beta-lactamase superfamily II)